MEARERAKRDLDKLDRMLAEFRRLGLDKRYADVYEYAANYRHDARHFFEKGDFFSAFGAANYAYGFIDAVLVIEGMKDEANIL